VDPTLRQGLLGFSDGAAALPELRVGRPGPTLAAVLSVRFGRVRTMTRGQNPVDVPFSKHKPSQLSRSGSAWLPSRTPPRRGRWCSPDWPATRHCRLGPDRKKGISPVDHSKRGRAFINRAPRRGNRPLHSPREKTFADRKGGPPGPRINRTDRGAGKKEVEQPFEGRGGPGPAVFRSGSGSVRTSTDVEAGPWDNRITRGVRTRCSFWWKTKNGRGHGSRGPAPKRAEQPSVHRDPTRAVGGTSVPQQKNVCDRRHHLVRGKGGGGGVHVISKRALLRRGSGFHS